LFGLDPLVSGSIELEGRPIRLDGPGAAMRHGIALVPEDRRRAGLVRSHSVRSNVLMASWNRVSRLGFVRDWLADRIANGFVERLKIRTPALRQEVDRLSGGNQQKVVVAKNLAIHPRVLLLDDPTVGIDVRSTGDILEEARSLAEAGTAIIFVSSELEELAALADRVMVLREGAVAGWLDRAAGDELSDQSLSSAVQTL
jgi:ABC-type sugar transport system ATPase subunit